jgi:DNA-binding beta-propeller fold protein YncE
VSVAALLVLGPLLHACSDPNQGVDPPIDRLFFPSGLLLDPRTPPGEPAHYLIVSNGNNDLSYNAGSLVVIDLDAFFQRWATSPDPDVPDYLPYPYCEGVEPGDRCVLDVGSPTSEDFPCRRLGLLPQVVECDERPFIVDAVRIGDFATVMAATTTEPSGVPRIFVPVRGDPSVTYVDVADGPDGTPDLRCGQPRQGSDASDGARCSDRNRLRWLRNDESMAELDREPFNVSIAEGEGYRYALVAHAAGTTLTVIDLDGIRGAPNRPAIVDTGDVFFPTGLVFRTGGFGIAQRPCGTCVEPGDPLGTNVPTVTQGCTRPMIYAAYRYQLSALNFTIDGLEAEDLPFGADTRNSCYGPPGPDRLPDGEPGEVFLGPFCAEPDDIGQPCAVICDPQVLPATSFPVAGVDPFSTSTSATLGNIAFADECGDKLYLIQTNPGALLAVDTSLDIDNETLDIAAGPPLEVCDQPTRFTIWHDAGFAFVSCYQSAYIYIVDLAAWQVVGEIISGTGPHDLVVDEAREVLYAANALEGSISVIDLGQDRPTRFTEIARIGLQEPFSR